MHDIGYGQGSEEREAKREGGRERAASERASERASEWALRFRNSLESIPLAKRSLGHSGCEHEHCAIFIDCFLVFPVSGK